MPPDSPPNERDDSRDPDPPPTTGSSRENANTGGVEPEATSAFALLGQVIGNRYRVEEQLGQGGMGAVYRAEHIHIKKSFALKVLHPELTHHAESVKRFEREAIAAARIDHPNVATAIDFGKLPTGEFYLVLDYVQGESLRALLRKLGAIEESRTVRIIRQIALALAAAHAANIVHRDLKPDNVMLLDSGAMRDLVKVLDFGIAKLRTEDVADEPAITRFGTVFGTPEYMSPEQALGQTVDARSDLYSLGIVAYEMLKGVTPFADEQLVTVLTRQLTDIPDPLVNVSRELNELVMQLLEKRPEARPATAERVIERLDELAPPLSTNLIATAASGADRPPIHTADTMLALIDGQGPGRIDKAPSPFSSKPLYSMPVWAKRQITVRGRRLPWVLIALGSALVTLTVVFTLTVGSLVTEDAPSPPSNSPLAAALAISKDAAESKQIAQWIVLASQGDKEALAALEARPEAKSSGALWLAIGAGRANTKSFGPALQAYERAFQLDPKVPLTTQTYRDLYQAALVTETSKLAVELSLKYLGDRGADLIYALYEATAAVNPSKLDRKKLRQLLDSEEVRQVASSSLKVALDLDAARTCTAYKSLLSSASSDGDARSHKTLRKLTYDRGCGFMGLRDCYSCLRGGRALAEAIENTKSRAAPSF